MAWRSLNAIDTYDLAEWKIVSASGRVAVSGGASLPIIGALLGHANSATTQRYARLSDDPLREASDAVGRRITASLNATPSQDSVKKLFGDDQR